MRGSTSKPILKFCNIDQLFKCLKEFEVKIGKHLGSVLSPLLLAKVADVIT